MTIDEAIKHCLEVVKKNEQAKKDGNLWIDTEYEDCCADHRQLAEWLTELKELRTLVAASNVLAKDVLAVDTLCKQILEYKRLLKLSLEQNNPKCKYCIHDLEDEQNGYNPCCTGETANCKWIYADEALKLIGGSENG